MKKFFILMFGAAAVFSAAGPLGATTQITGLYASPSFACPGQSLAVSVTYCENQPNADSYFLAAFNPSGTLQPCPGTGQVFVVDSNGLNTDDSSPAGGWSAGNASPVSACSVLVWNVQVPAAYTNGVYNLVVAGHSGGISCGGAVDSQMAVPVTFCGTQVPTATPYPSGTPFIPTPTPSPTASATVSPTGTPASSPTATPSATSGACLSCTATPTISPTFTPTPPPTQTPTASPTPASTGVPYANTVQALASALGCGTDTVEAVRRLDLDPQTSYILMRITVLCGCTPADILNLRLTMGWDEICAHYGIDWASFASDLQARVGGLLPEIVTPNQVVRAAANDATVFMISDPAPGLPDTLGTGRTYRENCPLCK